MCISVKDSENQYNLIKPWFVSYIHGSSSLLHFHLKLYGFKLCYFLVIHTCTYSRGSFLLLVIVV